MREQRVDAGHHLRDGRHRLRGLDEVIALVRKIQRRLEPRHHVEERALDGADGHRERAFELIEGRARLERRDGIDQIGDGLGLDQIELAVEKGAKGELARFGQPRAGFDGAREDRGQHHGAAVRRDLDHVFAGVGLRRRERRDDELVADAMEAVGPADRLRRGFGGREAGLHNELREGGVTGLEGPVAAHERARDSRGVRAAQANDADAATAARRRDCDDGV